MNRRIKEMKTMLDRAGLTLVEFKDKKDSRITVVARAGTEETRVFSISGGSTSDWNGDRNEQARMRRFAKECPPPPLNTAIIDALKPLRGEFKHVATVAPPDSPKERDPSLDLHLPPGYKRVDGELVFVGDLEPPSAAVTEPVIPKPEVPERPPIQVTVVKTIEELQAARAALILEKQRASAKLAQAARRTKAAAAREEKARQAEADRLEAFAHSEREAKREERLLAHASQRKEPAMPKRAPEAPVARRTLTLKEKYALIEWLKTQNPAKYKLFLNLRGAAALALGFPVSPTTMHEAMDAAGFKMPIAVGGARVKGTTADALRTIASELCQLLEDLGKQPSVGLTELRDL